MRKSKTSLVSRFAACCLTSLLILLTGCSSPRAANTGQVQGKNTRSDPTVGADLASLRKQARAAEDKVRRLEALKNRLYPGGPIIVVDTAQSKISLLMGSKIITQGTCSTGNGMELADSAGKRSWTFDTPRGSFHVVSKIAAPVWYRPDWSFIEEGEPIPKDPSKRAQANVLGDYAIAFGNGFYIHGTLYTRLLGANVTHGCIRVNDDVLKKIYEAAHPGMPIWIY